MTTPPIVVVIPTKDKYLDAHKLAAQVARDPGVAAVRIYDNRDHIGRWYSYPWDTKITVINASGMGVYEMWNAGWKSAAEWARTHEGQQAVDVAILNDDITLLPGSLTAMSHALRSCDDVWLVSADWRERCDMWAELHDDGVAHEGLQRVRGTFRNLGICGWCFMIKGEKLNNPLPPIDTQFKWWCGDDDLCAQINLAGAHTAIALGVPVDHEGSATARLYPELDEVGWQDLQRLERKYLPR